MTWMLFQRSTEKKSGRCSSHLWLRMSGQSRSTARRVDKDNNLNANTSSSYECGQGGPASFWVEYRRETCNLTTGCTGLTTKVPSRPMTEWNVVSCRWGRALQTSHFCTATVGERWI